MSTLLSAIRSLIFVIVLVVTVIPWALGVLLLLVILFRPLGLISFLLGERERVGSFGAGPQQASKETPDAP